MPPSPRLLAAEARRVRSEYALCDHCMGRVFARRARATDHARLGRRIRDTLGYAEPRACGVCRGAFAQLGEYCDEMVRLTERSEFSTFLVGATLKPSMLDADDDVRARYGLRGTQSAKLDVTTTLSKMFARRTGARATTSMPDVTLKADLRKGFVSTEASPVFVQARYTKTSRSIPQKSNRCKECGGGGCARCAHRGIAAGDSVEARIGEALCDAAGARQARFLWCGSEEAGGTVGGNGRPFFARLVCPSRRRAALPRMRALGGGVAIRSARYISAHPGAAPRFSHTATVSIEAGEEIEHGALRALKKAAGGVIDYDSGGRRRAVHSISYRQSGARAFRIRVRVDSGFPLRRFVESSSISPNVSDLLQVRCRYVVADFADIVLARGSGGGADSGRPRRSTGGQAGGTGRTHAKS